MKGSSRIQCVITKDTEYDLEFTIESIDLSIVNAIRRTILSNIPAVVFCTSPHEKDRSIVYKNTTMLNNEIIKHRLSGIPIHHLYTMPPEYLSSIMMELKVENITDQFMMVTSKDFTIKNKSTGEYLPREEVVRIFPPSRVVLNEYGIESYSDIVKLRPRIQDMPGDSIHITCEFDLGNALEDSQYNVVSTCSYGYSRDEDLVRSAFETKKQEVESSGISPEEIAFKLKDWMLLESYRFTRANSFDFIVETLGVYSNKYIVTTAIDIIVETLDNIERYIEIHPGSIHTEYKVLLYKDDYTIGKLLEIAMYNAYFEKEGLLNFCGFKKAHPHDTFATIRLDYKDPIGESYQSHIVRQLKESIRPTINSILTIKMTFME